MKSLVLGGVVLLLLLAANVEAGVKPNVAPYRVDSTLSNVSNLEEFQDALDHYSRKPFALSAEQKQALARNGFVVQPGDAEQFFQVYESNHYGMRPRIPNFISADCAMQLYHLLYDFTLKSVEVQNLQPALTELTRRMLAGSLEQDANATDSLIKAAAFRNVIFFAVPARLLNLPTTELPPLCAKLVDQEVKKINSHAGRDLCKATESGLDYTQFSVRGHYTRSPEMEAYFKAMMWYGTAGLPMDSCGVEEAGSVFQTLLMTDLLFENADDADALIRLWDKIYAITALYVGASNNLEPHMIWNALPHYSAEPLATAYRPNNGFESLWRWYFRALPQPRIQGEAAGLNTGRQFRFMSQRFMPDSYVLQRLSSFGLRDFPQGMDVMAVLGSPRAAEILDSEPTDWKEYVPRRNELVKQFSEYDAEWNESLVAGWLHVLQALIEERGEGYPSFMQNKAWSDKQLSTALGSWSEMRRDVILYATPSYAEGGEGEDEIQQPKGYVEPAVEFWSRLLKQVQENRRILMAAGYLADDAAGVFARFEDLITLFRTVSIKELTGGIVTTEEYERIREFGGVDEELSLSILKLDRAMPIHDERTGDMGNAGEKPDVRNIGLNSWFQVTGPDRDIACIADVHTSQDTCLEEAVGHIDEIFVVVPIDGKLRMTRGGVFSYYEFNYPAPHRLNDEAWQEMIKRGRAPNRPKWVYSFVKE